MTALVERLIAARDRLKILDIADYAAIREAREAMADAANALTSPVRWDDVADEALGVMKAAADVAAKKAADDIYASVLDGAQDYLTSNLRFNIASKLDMAERQRLAMRERVRELAGLLTEALEYVADHQEAQRNDQTADLLNRIGPALKGAAQ